MNQLPENSLRIYDVTLVTSYLIGLVTNMIDGVGMDVCTITRHSHPPRNQKVHRLKLKVPPCKLANLC